MDFEKLHEEECVELVSDKKRSLTELKSTFKTYGFTFHDDVVSLDRKGRIPPWQHPSTVEVEVSCESEEVFGFDAGEWDLIRLKCLFATLPYAESEEFIRVAFALANALALPVIHNGTLVAQSDLKDRFSQIRDELIVETGEDVGSEGLAILIQKTYHRR